MHSSNRCLGCCGCIVGDEAEAPRPPIRVLLHSTADNLAKVLKVLPQDRVVPAVRNVVNEEICTNGSSVDDCGAACLGSALSRHRLCCSDICLRCLYCSLRLRLCSTSRCHHCGARWWKQATQERPACRHHKGWSPCDTHRVVKRHASCRHCRVARRHRRKIWRRFCPRRLPAHRVVIIYLPLWSPSLLPWAVLVVAPQIAKQPFA